MKVQRIMNRNVTTVRGDDTLSLALQTMLWAGIRHLPVLDGGRLEGVLTERDVLRFRASGVALPLTHPVREAMSRPVQTLHPEDPVVEAAERLTHERIGCLPVIQRGDLVGIVTRTDLLKVQVQEALSGQDLPPATARGLMTPDPLTAAPDDPVSDAVAKMSQAGVRHLPVVDGEGQLLGMLAAREVPFFQLEADTVDVRVGKVMSINVLTVEPDAPTSMLASAFTDWRLDAVPVVDSGGKLLGIISYIDLLNALVK